MSDTPFETSGQHPSPGVLLSAKCWLFRCVASALVFVAMIQTSLKVLACIRLTVQSTRSPGDGCCSDVSNGVSLLLSYPFHLDEMYEKIPEGADCDEETFGAEAISADGKMYQDNAAVCRTMNGPSTYRSVNLILNNGTLLDANIIYHPNGTVEADCAFDTRARPGPNPAQAEGPENCYGPKHGDGQEYVGIFTYGSLKSERYRYGNAFLDLDVDNGCIPIRQGPMTFTNVFFDEPDEGFFAIPHECFQQGAKASGRVTRPKSFFRSLETVV